MFTNAAWQASLLMPAPLSTVIAIAAQPPTNAQNGTGKNGSYTESLVQFISPSGADLNDVFVRTEQRAVRVQGAGRQLSWSSLNVTEGATGTGFYFKSKVAPQADDPKVFARRARAGRLCCSSLIQAIFYDN